MTVPDPLKASALEESAFSFRLRQQHAADIVLSEDCALRLEGAKALRLQGNECFRLKRIADSLSLYGRAMEHLQFCPPLLEERTQRDEERLLVLLNMSACHLHDKDFRLAERTASRALDIDPSNVKGFYRRARARVGLGNVNGALKDVERALALNPGEEERASLLQLQEMLQKRAPPSSE